MASFPATYELMALVLCLLLLSFGLAVYFRLETALGKSFEGVFARIAVFVSFPRSLLDPTVRVLPPLRSATFRRFVHRFKFTLFMFFLNVYTFIFTADLNNGQISPQVLEDRGFSYAHFAQHKWFILVTSNFIHFHVVHLALNMVVLLIFCGSLELLKGARFAAIVFLVAMNSDVPNGLFLIPGLKLLYPQLLNETVQYVDVGASLGIIGTLGALARLLQPGPRWLVMVLAVMGSLVGSIYIHNPFGIDHAFSAMMGYLLGAFLLRQESPAAIPSVLRVPKQVLESAKVE